MSDFSIPDDLIRMIAEQRVIPFLGAGFSSERGLPNWHDLLEEVAGQVLSDGNGEGKEVSFNELVEHCRGDNLQIAEYLFLRAGSSIGPLRHAMTRALGSNADPIDSSVHVELVNLGAPQVYTTNFDDLIEDAYRALGLTVEVIALPRHVASAHHDRTQIVKYHGDPRHDETLVLTESQYYARLDFESPMDLKFRSDLLGRSVLFMGYSFRDINIRVIWFKLMQMMKDVPVKDRPRSYIVRLEPNPVLDSLYEAVGLHTLVLDPNLTADTEEKRSQRLAEFMLELTTRCSRDSSIPGGTAPMHLSRALLSAVDIPDIDERGVAGTARGMWSEPFSPTREVPSPRHSFLLQQLVRRQIPHTLLDDAKAVFERTMRGIELRGTPQLLVELAGAHLRLGPSPAAVTQVLEALLRTSLRAPLLEAEDFPWQRVWSVDLSADELLGLLSRIDNEVEGHEQDRYSDEDIAYAVDIAIRIADGSLVGESDGTAGIRERAQALVDRAAAVYPTVADYRPSATGAPSPRAVVDSIQRRFEQRRIEEQMQAEGAAEAPDWAE